jgi:predicted lactoylglutathione lyase
LKKLFYELAKRLGYKTGKRGPYHTSTTAVRNFENQVRGDFSDYYGSLFASEMSAVNKCISDLRSFVDKSNMNGTEADVLCRVARSQLAAWRDRPAVIGLGLKVNMNYECMKKFLGMKNWAEYDNSDFLIFTAEHSKMLVSLQALDEYGASDSELMAALQKAFILFDKLCDAAPKPLALTDNATTDDTIAETDEFTSTPNLCILPCTEDADVGGAKLTARLDQATASSDDHERTTTFYKNLYEHFNRILTNEDKHRLALLADSIMAVVPRRNVANYRGIVAAYKENVTEQDARMIVRLIKATATAPVERKETKPARQSHGLIAIINIPGLNKIIATWEKRDNVAPENVLVPPMSVLYWIQLTVTIVLTKILETYIYDSKGPVKKAFDQHYRIYNTVPRDAELEQRVRDAIAFTYKEGVVDPVIEMIGKMLINWFVQDLGAKKNQFKQLQSEQGRQYHEKYQHLFVPNENQIVPIGDLSLADYELASSEAMIEAVNGLVNVLESGPVNGLGRVLDGTLTESGSQTDLQAGVNATPVA